jgi:hypothetical protein
VLAAVVLAAVTVVPVMTASTAGADVHCDEAKPPNCTVTAEQPGRVQRRAPREAPAPKAVDPGPVDPADVLRDCLACSQSAPSPAPSAVVGGITTEQLAARAVKQLPIVGPQIGSAPAPNGSGLVGLPVWLWTAVTPLTWGPYETTASVPGQSVSARATALQIVWDMGDGHQVTCKNPGTAYTAADGAQQSPDCGYRYARSSHGKPGGKYTVTGTTTWHISWWVNGSGSAATGNALTQTRVSQTTVQIDELQVVSR